MTQLTQITLDKLRKFAQQLADQLVPGETVCLWGDLGAGKTTLTRLILQALNPDITDVPSPTFTLIQQYDTPKGEVWHCDLYRLKHPDEIIELGLEDAFGKVICLIEWPEKMGDHLPENRLDLQLQIEPDLTRTIDIKGHGTVHVDHSPPRNDPL